MMGTGQGADLALQHLASEKVALVGAGKAGQSFIQWSLCEDVTLFTSNGEGSLGKLSAMPLTELKSEYYNKIIVASQYVDEISRDLLAYGVPESCIYWFDFLQEKLISLSSMGFKSDTTEEVLYAIYDLEVYPANFELAVFLARADSYRQLNGLTSMTVVLVRGRFNGVNARSILGQGKDKIDWRVQHILREIPQLLPSCVSFVHLERNHMLENLLRDAAFTYPVETQRRATSKDFAFGQLVKYWKQGADVKPYQASTVSKAFVTQYFRTNGINGMPVTLTLRESQYQESRNSGLELYHRIAQMAVNMGFVVVLVRDTEQALDEPLRWQGCIEFSVAAFDQAIRMALYELSYMNVSVSSGPSWGLMALSKNIDFFLTHPADDSHRNSSYKFLSTVQGINIHEQYPFHSAFQQMCWAVEDEQILADFGKIMRNKLAWEKGTTHSATGECT